LESKRHNYDIEVPVEIFDHIDTGQNPDLYLKKSLDECVSRNEKTKGKIHTLQVSRTVLLMCPLLTCELQSFKESLEKELGKSYPEELQLFQQFSNGKGMEE
jgi:hypothetical protein